MIMFRSELKNILSRPARRLPGGAARPGDALILTMFIIAGMLIVALSGAYVVTLSLRAGGIQAQSTKAYYAAESGAEQLLWQLRKNSYAYGSPAPGTPIFTGALPAGATYTVYFTSFPPLVFDSVGEFQNARRSAEIRIGS